MVILLKPGLSDQSYSLGSPPLGFSQQARSFLRQPQGLPVTQKLASLLGNGRGHVAKLDGSRESVGIVGTALDEPILSQFEDRCRPNVGHR